MKHLRTAARIAADLTHTAAHTGAIAGTVLLVLQAHGVLK